MAASLYLRNGWLNHLFGGTAFTMPGEWWVQLHTGDPGANCTANAWTAAGRAELASWTTAASLSNASADDVVFSDLPAPIGDVSYLSIWDAEIAGNPLFYGALASPITVSLHGTLTFNTGDIANTVT